MDELKVRRQIESNDPALVELEIGPSGYAPHDGDWGRLGTYIGRQTHLRDLTFCDPETEVTEEDFEKFFRGGVACSQSIQKLCFDQCDFFGGEIFRILLPLFKSSQVDCLELKKGILRPKCLSMITAALAEFDSLKEFDLTYCRADGNKMEELIRALAGHSGLRKLELTGNSLGRNACAASAALLQNPNSELSVLKLSDNEIDNEGADALAPGLYGNSTLKDLNLSFSRRITEMGWRAIFAVLQSPSCRLEKLSLACNDGINDAAFVLLSSALAINTHLKSLNLNYCSNITIVGWGALFGFLRGPNCALEELDLSNDGFNNDAAVSMSNALTNNRSLKTLNLSRNSGIMTAGWQAFSAVLQSTNSGLEELDLSNNMIIDESVNSIANALANNSRLRELNLSDNGQVTVTGWGSFSVVLESPRSALEKLDICWNEINDDNLISFANSLSTNSKLKELLLDLEDDNGIAFNGWDAFSRALCNPSSIMDTYQSNHTLEKISNFQDELPEDLRTLMELNRDNSKAQAARLKIIKTHFNGGFMVQPFIDMEQNVLPHAIAWMGRYEGINETTNHFYEFIRSVPIVFDINSKNKKRRREE